MQKAWGPLKFQTQTLQALNGKQKFLMGLECLSVFKDWLLLIKGRGREEYLRQGRAPGLTGSSHIQPLARRSPRLAGSAHPIQMALHILLHPILPGKLYNKNMCTQEGIGFSLFCIGTTSVAKWYQQPDLVCSPFFSTVFLRYYAKWWQMRVILQGLAMLHNTTPETGKTPKKTQVKAKSPCSLTWG